MRYLERRNISWDEALDEPAAVFERFLLLWSLDARRDKLEGERQRHARPKQ